MKTTRIQMLSCACYNGSYGGRCGLLTDHVSVRGDVLDTALGKVIDVRAIGSSPEQMTELAGPRQPRGPKGGPDRLGPPPPPPGFAPSPPPPPRG